MGRKFYTYSPSVGGATLNIPLGTMTLTPQAPTLSIAGGTPTGAFTPDPGFSYSGTPAFDQPFTVISLSNSLPASMPTLVLFDDGRNSTAGLLVAGTNPPAPVAGIGNYSSAGSFAPVWARSNRSGNGLACSILNNERAGGTGSGPFGRNVTIPFGSHQTGFYHFYAEHWRSTWDGRNDEGAGGGYYKMVWYMGDSDDAGATSDDLVLPVFVEGAQSHAGITSITWNSGVVTVNTSAPFGFAPGYGPTWRVTMGSGHSSGGTDQVPAAYAGDFTATQTGPNQFTYPLPNGGVSPGNVTVNGTFAEPGSIQGMNVPSNSCLTSIGGNSGTGQGVAGPQIIPAGDSNGLSKWDPNGWNCIEGGFVADPVNPLTAPGRTINAVWNAANNQVYNVVNTASNFLSSTLTAYGYFSRFHLTGLMQNIGTHTVDRTDVFLQIGPQAYYRFFITDKPTLAASTTVMPCTMNSTSANAASITLRQGGFTTPTGNYLWMADVNNSITRVGQFGTAQTFDFYIATNGLDTNPGTLAQPWSFASLLGSNQPNYNATIAANRAAMAGKRIGVLPGTYSLQTIAGVAGLQPPGDFSTPQYQVPPGTGPNAITVVQSTTPRGAILDGQWGTSTTQNTNGVPLFGTAMSSANTKYVTIDGFEVKNGSGHLMMVGGNSDFVSSRVPGITVQNCYLHGTLDNSNGGNSGAISLYSCDGVLFKNNYITNIVNTNGRNSGFEFWNCINQKAYSNTVVMNNAGASPGYTKNTGQFNVDYAGNIFDTSGAPSVGGSGSVAWDLFGTAANASFLRNNLFFVNNGFNIGISGVTTTSINEAINVINNTVVSTGTYVNGLHPTGSTTAVVNHYNNVYVSANQSGSGNFACSTCVPALSDYNMQKSFRMTTGGTQCNSLAAWQAAVPAACIGKDAHSVVATATFVGGSPTLPADGYQIVAGTSGSATSANPGSTNGQTTGVACDMGCWGNLPSGVTRVGCDHAHTPNV